MKCSGTAKDALNTFEYLCFNEANNLICILSSETQNKAISEGNF